MTRNWKTHLDTHGDGLRSACGMRKMRQSTLTAGDLVSCGRCRRTKAYRAAVIDAQLEADLKAERLRLLEVQATAYRRIVTRPVSFARRMMRGARDRLATV